MYEEDDFIQLSSLQHWVFCPRQCALIHLEGLWEENRLTVEGSLLHEKVHKTDAEKRGDFKIVSGLRIHSFALGLSGQTDAVEFYKTDEGIALEGSKGLWTAFPVEYKRGRPKSNRCDEIQLCAQALCLEEMLDTVIPKGALYYGKIRRRKEIVFTDELRLETRSITEQIHAMMENKITPNASYSKKCDSCSLYNKCLPKSIKKEHVQEYLEKAYELL